MVYCSLSRGISQQTPYLAYHVHVGFQFNSVLTEYTMSKQFQQPQQVFVLMHTTKQGNTTTHEPVGVYLDKEMALYDSWLLTDEDYHSRREDDVDAQYQYAPADYWVKDSYQVTERFNSIVSASA